MSKDKKISSEDILEKLRSGDFDKVFSPESLEKKNLALLPKTERLETVKAETQQFALDPHQSIFHRFFRDQYLYESRQNVWYKWATTYWKRTTADEIIKNIGECAKSVQVWDDKIKKWKLPCDNPTWRDKMLKYLQLECRVDYRKLNPKGHYNRTNGVLRITFEGREMHTELLPHHPELYMTDEPRMAFDPQAPTEDCDRFLTLLAPQDLDLMMMLLGNSLYPQIAPQFSIRVPACINKGLNGEEGKDSFMQAAVDCIGEESRACVTAQDWKDHDKGEGRGRFNVDQLRHARICIDSETCEYIRLDKLESFKKAITHNPIYGEGKHKDGDHFRPWCGFFYNANNLPQLSCTRGYVRSRFVVVEFLNRYSSDPMLVAKGTHLPADPLFAEDSVEKFEKVLPAFFNYMLAGLQKLIKQGGTQHTWADHRLEQMAKDTDHFHAFAEDLGLQYDKNDQSQYVYTTDLAIQLGRWYVENDYAHALGNSWEKDKNPLGALVFHDNSYSDKNDRTVRSGRDLIKKLNSVFPGIQTAAKGSKRKSAAIGLSITKPIEKSDAGPVRQAPAEESNLSVEEADLEWDQVTVKTTAARIAS